MSDTSSGRRRNPSVYILKFLAVMLITWSHMDPLVPVKGICTGGAIGDSLFLFCSGFTLFMGRGGDFFNWYKRRINRIYPSILSWAIVSCIFFGDEKNIVEIILYGGGAFITAIMVYYVGLYILRRLYGLRHGARWLQAAVGLYILVTLGFFLTHEIRFSEVFVFKTSRMFCLVDYFLCMVLGAVVGLYADRLPKPRLGLSLTGLAVSAALFFGFQFLCTRIPALLPWQILLVLPLWSMTYFLFRVCSTDRIIRIYEIPAVRRPVYWISCICLEVYLVQFVFFREEYSGHFPLNVLVVFLAIFLLAYVVKVLGNIILQIFKEEEFDWKAAFTL